MIQPMGELEYYMKEFLSQPLSYLTLKLYIQ